MAISVRCSCGKKFAAPYNLAGKRIKCPICKNPLEIPQRASPSGLLAAGKVTTTCACGKHFTAPKILMSKVVKCPSCSNPVRIGTTESKKESRTVDSFAALLDEVGAIKAKTTQSCPRCKAEMSKDAVICVACGYHTETGRQLKTKRIGRRGPL